MRPDFEEFRRQHRQIADFVGETATWQKYIGDTTGTAAYGIGNEPTYAARTITGLFRVVQPAEIAEAGGVYVAGDIQATLIDCAPAKEDRILWSGAKYRAESVPVAQAVIGRDAWTVLLRRGDYTG